MDEITDNTFTEIHAPELPNDDPSLLTLILELTPGGWYNIKDETSILDVVKSLLVFLNGHLSLNNSNQVSFIISSPLGAKILYPNPQKELDELRRPEEITNHDDTMVNDRSQPPSLIGKGMYRQFRIVDEVVLEQLNSSLNDIIESDTTLNSKLAGALSLALTYTNRMLNLDQSISTTTASAISSATKESSGAGSNGGNNSATSTYQSSARIKSRILIVTPNDNDDIRYISFMNGIFAAQKMKVPIDIAKLGKNNSSYLQQAADATNGIYLHIENPVGFIQVLSTAYFIEPSIRSLIILPTNSNVNYRASCFITGKSVEVGYVCSICLCIMSEIPTSMECPTCNSKFDETIIAKLRRKPIVKKRKLENSNSNGNGMVNGNNEVNNENTTDNISSDNGTPVPMD